MKRWFLAVFMILMCIHTTLATDAFQKSERAYNHYPDGLYIIWEDDGAGIPEAEKGRIFERGYGKNTGFGLYLVREILSITGIQICETGQEGGGARFEILVPEGGYRFRDNPE